MRKLFERFGANDAESVDPLHPQSVEGETTSPWQVPLLIFNVVVGLVTLTAVFVKDLLGLAGPRWAEILVMILGFSLAGIFLTLVAVQFLNSHLLHQTRTKYERRARFAQASGPLREAHTSLRDALHQLRNNEPHIESVRAALGSLATAYSVISGAVCRASIKRVGYDSDDPELLDFYVTTYARDPESGWQDHDDEPDLVVRNTDFEVLFGDPDRPWWMANDLRKVVPYNNTHWDEHTIQDETYDYLATIVWPIRRTWHQPTGERRDDMLGFLCIDTLTADAFSRATDLSFGATIADHLYMLLYEVRERDVADAPDLNNDAQ